MPDGSVQYMECFLQMGPRLGKLRDGIQLDRRRSGGSGLVPYKGQCFTQQTT